MPTGVLQQSELSDTEMRAAAPAFLAKIARYRPRIVCFVGLKIASAVQHSAVLVTDSLSSFDSYPYALLEEA